MLNKRHRFLIPVSPSFQPISNNAFQHCITKKAVVTLFNEMILEKVFQIRVMQDGDDATAQFLQILSYPLPKIHLILLKGVTFAGLNFFNPFLIYNTTGIPIIIFHPSRKKSLSLKQLRVSFDVSPLLAILDALPPPREFTKDSVHVMIQTVGLSFHDASLILNQIPWEGNLPLILRMAYRIGRPIHIN